MYSKNHKNYWLFVESEFNRKQDEINGYKNLGISKSKSKKLIFNKGDIIFTYISKIKKFSDIRQVIDNKIHLKPLEYEYDREFKKAIKTKMIKLLAKNEWLDYTIISKELKVFINSTSPANKLLNAPILLEFDDYQTLKNYNLFVSLVSPKMYSLFLKLEY